MTEITQETRDKLNEIIDRGLCLGIGEEHGQMCIEAAICIAYGEPFSDAPTCVHPAVRAFSIRLNDADWSSSAVRADALRAFALNQLGTTQIDGVAFARKLALRTIREILPIALRAAGLEEHAKACESAADLEAEAAAAAAAAEAAAWAAEAARAAAAAAWAERDQILILSANIANEVLSECKQEAGL